jgi:hypothetical protein
MVNHYRIYFTYTKNIKILLINALLDFLENIALF